MKPKIWMSLLVVGSICFYSGNAFSADVDAEKKETAPVPLTPSAVPALPEAQQKAMNEMEASRKKMQELMKERRELMEKQAPQEQIQQKTKEIETLQQDTIKIIQAAFPQAKLTPPAPRPMPQLTPEQKQEIQMLIEERQKKVRSGATSEEVKSITEKIQKVYGSALTVSAKPTDAEKKQ